ncbi:MAG: ATP-grasp domain-containing protein, partial [Myxococcales bacterium]
VATVAVYSDADRHAPHVVQADEAVLLGDAAPSASYLNIDKLIAAARQTGAEALHPGYGFLSENPVFAERVAAGGLVFIGPGAEAMRRLGDKVAARNLARQAGVPTVPGMDAPEADENRLAAAAERIGYPVLIKASAGGGGKGMRVVERPQALPEAARLAASEAQSAFGDGRIFLEKYLPRPRHVEIQVLGDHHGSVIYLGERECSIQRRHQKIVEESPSPALDAALRRRMGEAAVRLAKAAGYTNAGTVEFLLDESGDFYFLEVNTRLQVEHPVTEMVTGLDLVRLQLNIAAGQPLGIAQSDVAPRGHAIECRIYAEDPAAGFIPSPGRILLAEAPAGPGIRYDHAVVSGMEVPVHYDPLLGKLIAFAETREACIARMKRALAECVVLGVRTPIEYLIDVLSHSAFEQGKTHTHFLGEHFAAWRPDAASDTAAAVGYLLETAHGVSAPSGAARTDQTAEFSPWRRLGRWDLAEG